MKTLFLDFLTGYSTPENVYKNEILHTLQEKLNSVIEEISKNSPTAVLWFQYIKQVELITDFSFRTRNWDLHFLYIRLMLPYFHAATYHYAKSAHLYVQQCDDLERMHKNEYEKFVKQYFTIRRSEEFWTGVPTDQVIEQELMRNFKGQMTHERGIT
ncbi:unnamed protein product [Ceutorhynchus assimilis]|uniref:Uncharacterized protein n=1 Tax=Ceutorhynchus assimilis TaxID=467358 RepID=A0A9N9QMC7_9CUCU|nr:unnamed protein product [Ceutorhynchus assimilis]